MCCSESISQVLGSGVWLQACFKFQDGFCVMPAYLLSHDLKRFLQYFNRL